MKIWQKALIAASGCAILAATPAHAATAGAIVFQGVTTSLTPVQTIGGGGGYAFDTSNGLVPGVGICAAVGVNSSAGVGVGAQVDSVAPAPCFLSASGTYVNIVCGTGTTGGAPLAATDTATATVTTTVNASSPQSITANFGIVFVAGLGVSEGRVVAGVVQITPTGGDCTTAVTQFTATGVSVAVTAP
jgi:hypothetical protein